MTQDNRNDKDACESASSLILQLINLNSHIENRIWMSAFWKITTQAYLMTGYYYQHFHDDTIRMMEYYKREWEPKKDPVDPL